MYELMWSIDALTGRVQRSVRTRSRQDHLPVDQKVECLITLLTVVE
jgi:hypothetical protein